MTDALLGFPSSGYMDDLAWAAAWLHKRTGNATYLDDAHSWFTLAQLNGSQQPVQPMAWNYDNQLPGAAVLIADADNWKNDTIVPQVGHVSVWQCCRSISTSHICRYMQACSKL